MTDLYGICNIETGEIETFFDDIIEAVLVFVDDYDVEENGSPLYALKKYKIEFNGTLERKEIIKIILKLKELREEIKKNDEKVDRKIFSNSLQNIPTNAPENLFSTVPVQQPCHYDNFPFSINQSEKKDTRPVFRPNTWRRSGGIHKE